MGLEYIDVNNIEALNDWMDATPSPQLPKATPQGAINLLTFSHLVAKAYHTKKPHKPNDLRGLILNRQLTQVSARFTGVSPNRHSGQKPKPIR